MSSSWSPVALPVLLAASVVVAACGSDEESSQDEAPETTEVADDAVTSAPDRAPDAGAADDHEDDHDDDHGDEDDHDDGDHDDGDHDDEDDHGDGDHDDHDGGSGGLGAHEHGTAELSVAWIDSAVAIDLVSPTFNVFGFEYEPTSDEDLAIEADRTEALTESGVITLDGDAGCELSGPVSTEVERDGSHSEITVSWSFECENADAIGQVDASGLFAEFPNFEDVDVQWISDSQQSSAELTPSTTTFTLQR